jgi:hypothetical protein
MGERRSMPRANTAPSAGTTPRAPAESSAARLVRFLKAELRVRGELERPLTVLAFGGPHAEIARELRAEGLERCELVAVQGSWHERDAARDLADGAFRRMLPRVDVLLLDGVLERLADPVAALRELADRARYLVFGYDLPTTMRARAGRLSEIELRILARSLGVELASERPGERLPAFLVRTVAAARPAA